MSQLFILPAGIRENMMKTVEKFFLKKGLEYKIFEDDDEAIKRIKESLKLEEKSALKIKSIRINGYILNPGNQKLSHKSKKIILTRKEFEFLHFMFLNRKSVIDRNTILERVWGLQSNPFTNTVDVHVSHLRKKLIQSGMDIIKTVYGVGYKLEI